MRKSMLAVIIVLCSLMAACGGTVSEKPNIPVPEENVIDEESVADYTRLYKETLKEIYDFVLEADTEREMEMMGIWEAVLALGEEAAETVGYSFRDLNGDNVPELIVGVSDKPETAYTKNEIYAVYTLTDEKPVLVLEGRSRSEYSLMENNGFFYHGSGGAAYSMFGEYHLAETGVLECDKVYFTYPDENEPETIELFFNTTGEWEKAASEKLNISMDEFWETEKEMAQKTVNIEFVPLSEMGNTQ